MLGDAVAPVLESHVAASANRFRGIRFSCAWDASPEVTAGRSSTPGMLGDATFRAGFDRLQRMGLSFDALVYHTQLGELADLAGAFPDAIIILNHIGRPLGVGPYAGRRDEVFADWQTGIASVAAHENVVVKLGGFGNVISGYDWHRRDVPPNSEELADTIRPWLDYCIEHFGPERCMCESNFPVDKASYPYTTAWNAFKRVTAAYSDAEKAAMFQGTAVRAYRFVDTRGGQVPAEGLNWSDPARPRRRIWQQAAPTALSRTTIRCHHARQAARSGHLRRYFLARRSIAAGWFPGPR